MTYWNDILTVARWGQPGYETVKRIYHVHLAAIAPHSSTSHLLWHHILVPGSQCPSQGCKKRVYEMPRGSTVEMKYLPPLLTVPLLTAQISVPCCILIAFSILFSFSFLNWFFISYLVYFYLFFALNHSESLSSPGDSRTTAITWSLANHKADNLPHSLRRREVSENQVRARHSFEITFLWVTRLIF